MSGLAPKSANGSATQVCHGCIHSSHCEESARVDKLRGFMVLLVRCKHLAGCSGLLCTCRTLINLKTSQFLLLVYGGVRYRERLASTGILRLPVHLIITKARIISVLGQQFRLDYLCHPLIHMGTVCVVIVAHRYPNTDTNPGLLVCQTV